MATMADMTCLSISLRATQTSTLVDKGKETRTTMAPVGTNTVASQLQETGLEEPHRVRMPNLIALNQLVLTRLQRDVGASLCKLQEAQEALSRPGAKAQKISKAGFSDNRGELGDEGEVGSLVKIYNIRDSAVDWGEDEFVGHPLWGSTGPSGVRGVRVVLEHPRYGVDETVGSAIKLELARAVDDPWCGGTIAVDNDLMIRKVEVAMYKANAEDSLHVVLLDQRAKP
jgi:hypothetical protein